MDEERQRELKMYGLALVSLVVVVLIALCTKPSSEQILPCSAYAEKPLSQVPYKCFPWAKLDGGAD